MVMIRYSDLTQEQKDNICNGCGGKGSWIPVPNFIFKASCNQHDFYYWRGCSEKDRKIADDAFYKYMKIDIEERTTSIVDYLFHHGWAYTYYLSVRYFGKPYFEYSDNMKTAKDL